MTRKILLFIFTCSLVLALGLPQGAAVASQQTVATATASRWLTITSPNGGQVFSVGATLNITWNSSSNIDKVSIGYKGCASCLNWIATNIPNSGSYSWKIPAVSP